MPIAFVNGRVLQPSGFVEGLAVLVDGGRITDVIPVSEPRVRQVEHHDLHGQLLLPGFIDTHVNGGGGVLFNDNPGVESIREVLRPTPDDREASGVTAARRA